MLSQDILSSLFLHMKKSINAKITIIFATLLVAGIGVYALLYTSNQQLTYSSTLHGFQVTLPKDFVQEVVSNPENIAFTRTSYLPFSELTPNIQLLVADLEDISSPTPKPITTLAEYIRLNELLSFGDSPSQQARVVNIIPTDTYCRLQGLRTCITYALLQNKQKVLKIILNYPTQGEFSGKQDPNLEAAFIQASTSLKFTK